MCVSIVGCNTLAFTYARAPTLAYWWLDSYLDLEDRQAPQVRQALRGWFDWHRRHAVPQYRELLLTLQRQLTSDTTPAAVCALNTAWQQQLAADYASAILPLTELALTLTPAQLDHLERQFAKHQVDLAEEYLDGSPAARDAHVVGATLDALKALYGRLTRAQRGRLATLVAAAPFDPARWLDERRARQADILSGLRALPAAGAAEPAERRAAAAGWLQTLASDFFESPRLDYRAHHAEVLSANCALIADLHNRMSPAQRARAIRKVIAWREALATLLEGTELSRAERAQDRFWATLSGEEARGARGADLARRRLRSAVGSAVPRRHTVTTILPSCAFDSM